MGKIRVFVVDSDDIMRRGLVELLKKEQGLDIAGSASCGREVLEKIDAAHPHILLVDLRMQNMSGAQLIKKVHKIHPEVRCIIFTRYDEFDEEYIFDCINAGAEGYILKNVSLSELVEDIKTISMGGTILSPKVASKLFNRFRELASGRHTGSEDLSEREKEVVKLIAQGFSNNQIADKLYISNKTVKTHVAHILEKFGASNRTEAVVASIRKGLITIYE
jgi:DNA-binding NarL/FixJ family response regulator